MEFIGSWKRNMAAIGILILFYIGFGLFLYVKQESIVYQPFSHNFNDCPELAGVEKVEFDGTRMYYKKVGPKIFVIYHGNAGSACDRAFIATIAEQAGYSYLVPEYAGYSNDSRKPSHDAVKQDADHAIRFLKDKDFSNVVIFGESIGTGVAAYHAAHEPPSKIILISPFTNLVDIARDRFWFYPAGLLVKNTFDNVNLLSKFEGRILVAHGDEDELIPYNLGKRLFDSLPSQKKEFMTVEGSGHNTMYESVELLDRLREFLK